MRRGRVTETKKHSTCHGGDRGPRPRADRAGTPSACAKPSAGRPGKRRLIASRRRPRVLAAERPGPIRLTSPFSKTGGPRSSVSLAKRAQAGMRPMRPEADARRRVAPQRGTSTGKRTVTDTSNDGAYGNISTMVFRCRSSRAPITSSSVRRIDAQPPFHLHEREPAPLRSPGEEESDRAMDLAGRFYTRDVCRLCDDVVIMPRCRHSRSSHAGGGRSAVGRGLSLPAHSLRDGTVMPSRSLVGPALTAP